MLERIIKASSNPGDIVLDSFAGSFTTAAVASRLGRRSISIELNEDYYEIGLRRCGLATMRNNKVLTHEKVRKTAARSKYVRN